jgi:hypothetical protein
MRHALLLAALLTLPMPATATSVTGPPWISIELPANPHDRTTRGAFMLVHAFHHGTPTGFPVKGVAEGIVNGQRKTVQLTLRETSRTGVYAVDRQWDEQGEWTVVVTVSQGENDVAQAMVQISNGHVFAVNVPTERRDGWSIPKRISQAEIESSLRSRTTLAAARSPR